MLLVYPSILLPPPTKADRKIKTIVGIKDQLAEWPNAVLEPGACNDIPETQKMILTSGEKQRCVPLVEKVVLACGVASAQLGLKKSISLEAALNCTDRLKQRRAIEKTGLNPRWSIDGIGDLKFPLIVKRPASARSNGVKLVKNRAGLNIFLKNKERNAQERRLHEIGHSPAYEYISEEFVEGDSWEVTGISKEKVEYIFPPIRQIWNPPVRWIDDYRLEIPPSGLVESAVRAVEACGLKWSPWCVELKGYDNNWRVIEINGRLGEDGRGYYKKLGGTLIADKICELLA